MKSDQLYKKDEIGTWSKGNKEIAKYLDYRWRDKRKKMF